MVRVVHGTLRARRAHHRTHDAPRAVHGAPPAAPPRQGRTAYAVFQGTLNGGRQSYYLNMDF